MRVVRVKVFILIPWNGKRGSFEDLSDGLILLEDWTADKKMK